MSNSSNKFPPPLKEALPSGASQGHPATVVYRQLFPWELYPPGTAVLVLGAAQDPPPTPSPESLPSAEDDNYRLERRELSYLSFILSSWQRGVLALALEKPARSFLKSNSCIRPPPKITSSMSMLGSSGDPPISSKLTISKQSSSLK